MKRPEVITGQPYNGAEVIAYMDHLEHRLALALRQNRDLEAEVKHWQQHAQDLKHQIILDAEEWE